MWFTPIRSSVRRRLLGMRRERRLGRKATASRRALVERLEDRTLLSGLPLGVVLTSVADGTTDRGFASFLQSDGKIVVAGDSSTGTNADNFAVFRYGADGMLDPTFGNAGIVTTAVSTQKDVAVAAVGHPDGRITAGGYAYRKLLGVWQQDSALVRYRSDGSRDPQFSQDGMVIADMGGRDIVRGLAIDPFDNLVAAGIGNANGEKFRLARYTPAGMLDTSFGGDGIVELPLGASTSRAYAVAMHQGKILALGQVRLADSEDFALVRFNLDGTLDTTFGQDGMVFTDFSSPGILSDDIPSSMAILPDGRIIVAGETAQSAGQHFLGAYLAVARYSAQGVLDATFGTNGLTLINFGYEDQRAFGVAMDGFGRIVAAGEAYTYPAPGQIAVARLNADGSADTTFGQNGMVVTSVGNSSLARSVLIQPVDGQEKIVATGWVSNDARDFVALARYNDNGSLDATFGAPIPALSIDDVSVREGNGQVAVFTVSLSQPSNQPVTVSYATVEWTAKAGQDYTATSGSVTFAPQETSKPIAVPILDDAIRESGDGLVSGETFSVRLSNPSRGITIVDGKGQATIVDDDPFGLYVSADVPKSIPDRGTVTSHLGILDSFAVADVNVQLSITHTKDEDLDVFVIAPDGTRVELFTDVGGTGDNFINTTFDDEAATLITSGTPPFSAAYRPEGGLSALVGKAGRGSWYLEITDDSRKDAGVLQSWSLMVTPSGQALSAADIHSAPLPAFPGDATAAQTLQGAWNFAAKDLASIRAADLFYGIMGGDQADAEQSTPRTHQDELVALLAYGLPI
ncbi:MAG: proprotein convertase P-domain-containing protein [Pirellulales bacterium]|nr:proprotein convertase P-domain-containing protein [Pirellulales bacterium]